MAGRKMGRAACPKGVRFSGAACKPVSGSCVNYGALAESDRGDDSADARARRGRRRGPCRVRPRKVQPMNRDNLSRQPG